MKFGMNMLLWTTDVTFEHYPILDRLAEIGYDGVELPVFDADAAKYAAIGKQLDGAGLQRTAVTICTAENNPIGATPQIRQAAVEHLKQAVDMCAAAGATHLCGPIHSALGEFSGRGPTGSEWNHGKETLARAADHAQANGVTLVVEYLNRFECYFLNCAADCSRFVREVGHPHLKMMYDTFHANIEEKNIGQAIRECADQTVHVHISENDRSTPGEGQVDWDTTFATLKETYRDGWLMVEAFGLALPDLAAATKIWRRMFSTELELAQNALAFMRNRWNNG